MITGRPQLRKSRSGGRRMDTRAHLLNQGDIPVDCFIRDAEVGDNVADDTARLRGFFKHIDPISRAGEEISRGESRRTAADDGDLFAARSRRTQVLHQRFVPSLCRSQLPRTDADGVVIEVTGTLGHTPMGADRAGDKRQRILLGDNVERFFIESLIRQADIFGDILSDRTASLTRRRVTVEERHSLIRLARGQGLDRLCKMGIVPVELLPCGDLVRARTAKGRVLTAREQERALMKAVIAAGLEDGRRHRDRPDARLIQREDIRLIRAARIGDAQLAVKFSGESARHLDGQMEQRATAHIHFLARQLVILHIYREGIR